MKSSKLTTKYQTTIPKEIRDILHLKPGDAVTFHIGENNTIVLKKSKNFDKAYMQALTSTLNEWESKDDEENFKHLQDI